MFFLFEATKFIKRFAKDFRIGRYFYHFWGYNLRPEIPIKAKGVKTMATNWRLWLFRSAHASDFGVMVPL
jgi:hypothetical protein